MLKTTETLLVGLAANDQSRWARFYRDYAPWIDKKLREKGLMALRRVFADPTIRETSKIAFRRIVQLGEDVATVARDLNLEPNAVYQIKNRMKERLGNEIRKIQELSPDGV